MIVTFTGNEAAEEILRNACEIKDDDRPFNIRLTRNLTSKENRTQNNDLQAI